MMNTGTQFGRYEIRTKIGEGGMGEVYSAHDSELNRTAAIKLLPSEFNGDEDRIGRFRQEALVVSALNHPNIITIYEIGENEHGTFLATEYIEGLTLRELMKSESITLPRILKIVEQLANALDAAHHANIVHRDVKPENIMVRRDSIVKVLDFGLAKPTPAAETKGNSSLSNISNNTIPGTVMGSARYMSPEQARGLEVDERTDIWSVGVVLYEMLVGMAPFNGETPADTIAAVIYKEPEPIHNLLPNLPSEIGRILRKALQKDRDERYQSIKDLALDLKEVIHALEHDNSGERSGHTTSNPQFFENPTIIHTTVSANHEAHKTVVMAGGPGFVRHRKGGRPVVALGALAAMVLIAAAGFGFYSWFSGPTELVHAAFERPQISRISTDGKVVTPAISPDGKYVAYVAGEFGNRSLVVRQISTDSMVTIVPTTNLNLHSVTFSPNGDYVYYCQARSDNVVNTLFQVPTLGGAPKKLVEDVDSTVTFSPDGKRFAFIRHTSATNEDIIFTVDAATLETDELIRTTQTGYDLFAGAPSWSPDGRTIVLGAGRRDGGTNTSGVIAEIVIAEKTFRPLNGDRFFAVGHFQWFRDGSGFLFAGRETQTGPLQIWRASYPAAEILQITNDFNDYFAVGLASDGKTIVTLKGDTTSSLWRVSPKGADNRQLTPEARTLDGNWGMLPLKDGSLVFTRNDGKLVSLWRSEGDGRNGSELIAEKGFAAGPVMTPDGKYIIYNFQKEKGSRIWRMDADGKNAVQLTADDPNFADFNPQVTPDGRTIIFHRQSPKVERTALMKMPVAGGPVEEFHSDEKWNVFMPRISPDGKRIAYGTYNTQTWEKTIQIATIEGGRFGKVERSLEYNLINQFQWSPDSKSLTALSNRSGTQNIWRLPIDGSAPTQLTDFSAGKLLNFAWSTDGSGLFIARGNTNNDLILIRDTDRAAERENAARRADQGGSRRSTL